MIVVFPAPSIVALPASLIFTTLVSLLVNVNVPVDGDVGFSRLNSASPNFFDSVVSLPKEGTACFTVNVNV